MTNTDRAFIAALQQQSVGIGGPHYAGAAPQPTPAPTTKAPLSEHLARRAAQNAAPVAPAAPEATTPIRPGVEVESLPWPQVAERLAHAGRKALLDLLAGATSQSKADTPVIALIGSRPGVGTTTTLLSIARVVSGVGGKVALLDLSTGAGAAGQLGVRLSGRISHAFDPIEIDDLIVASREDQTSVVALGSDAPTALVESATRRLAATHDLVLIDAGDAETPPASLGGDHAANRTVLVIDAAPVDSPACGVAARAFNACGVVETFADAA